MGRMEENRKRHKLRFAKLAPVGGKSNLPTGISFRQCGKWNFPTRKLFFLNGKLNFPLRKLNIPPPNSGYKDTIFSIKKQISPPYNTILNFSSLKMFR